MKIFLLALTVLYSFSLYSQIDVKEISQITRNAPDVHTESFIAKDETSAYVTSSRTEGKGTDHFIEKYDLESGKELFSAPIDQRPYYVASSDKVLIVFYFKNAYPGLKGAISYTIISKENGKEIEKKDIGQVGQFFPEKGMRVRQSPDGKKLLVMMKEMKLTKLVKLQVYETTSMKLVETKEITPELNGKAIKIGTFLIDNAGTIGFPYSYLKTKDITAFGFGIIKAGSSKAVGNDLNIGENKILYCYSMKHSDNGNIHIAGLFKEEKTKGKKEQFDGIYAAEIDGTSGTIKTESSEYHPSEVHKKIGNENFQIFELHEGIEDQRDLAFRTNHLFTIKNDHYLVVESCYVRFLNNDKQELRNHELIITKIGSDGKIAWTRIILKKNSVSSYSFHKREVYHAFVHDNKLNFVFIDNPKNESIDHNNYNFDDVIRTDDPENMNVINVSLDENGIMKREIIYKNEPKKSIIDPIQGNIILSGTELLIYLRGENGEKFGKLIYK